MIEDIQTENFEDVQYIKEKFSCIKKEIEKVIVGQDEMIEAIIIALFLMGTFCWKVIPAWGRL